LRSTDTELLIFKLTQLGIETRPPVDEEGNPLPVEARIGRCNTPALIDDRGHVIVTALLSDAQMALLPEYLEDPVFVCDWRPDVMVEETLEITDPETDETRTEVVLNPLDWPEYFVPTEDGTIMQGAGRIVA